MRDQNSFFRIFSALSTLLSPERLCMCENHACERKLEFGTSRPCLHTQVSPFPLPHLGPLPPPPPRQETVPCKGYLWHSWALPPPFFVLYTAIYAPPFPRRERGGRPNISLKANGMGKGKEGWREREGDWVSRGEGPSLLRFSIHYALCKVYIVDS